MIPQAHKPAPCRYCGGYGRSPSHEPIVTGRCGIGENLVAFLSLLIAVEDGGQGVLMAPTEILARQHLEALSPLAEDAQVVIELLTGRDKGRERREKGGTCPWGYSYSDWHTCGFPKRCGVSGSAACHY